MEYKGIKRKLAEFISAVVEKRMADIEAEVERNGTSIAGFEADFKILSENTTVNLRGMEERLTVLEENVRNNNVGLSQLLGMVSRVDSLETNIRNINQQLEQMPVMSEQLNSLEVNIRNVNQQLEQVPVMSEQLNSLEVNIRNVNQQLEQMLVMSEQLNGLEVNIRNVNQQLEQMPEMLERVNNLETVAQNMMQLGERLQLLEVNVRNNNEIISHIRDNSKYEVLEAKIAVIKKELAKANISKKENEEASETVIPSTAKNDAYTEIDYFSFENYFRGSEELIKNRQKIYLPYFEHCTNVVDLGCGRGEFLELLKENGIGASGVDLYDEFVVYCQNKGLDVKCKNAVYALADKSEEVDGIFAGQIAEHLPYNQLIQLCKNAYDSLLPEKYFIIETPNPTTLAIYMNSFYMDPSHEKPVHPITLKYVLEKIGFRKVEILYTDVSKVGETIPELVSDTIANLDEFNRSMQKVANCLYGSQDYAIIAMK